MDQRELQQAAGPGASGGAATEGADEADLRRALLERPEDVSARLALAECLLGRSELNAAVEQFKRVLRVDPGEPRALRRLTDLYTTCRDGAAALALLDGWIRREPGRADLVWERGTLRLMMGDFRGGWEDLEARFRMDDPRVAMVGSLPQPRWDGEPFPGRTLLLNWEQGLGDTLMFIRYAPLAKARGGRVVAVVQPALVDVVRTCAGLDEVLPDGAPLPPFDLHLPLMSLPGVFRTGPEEIPSEVPYLGVPAEVPRRERLERLLAGPTDKLRVGLVWEGSSQHVNNRFRSLPPEALAPLEGLEGVLWHSFQVPAPADFPLPAIDVGRHLATFADTAFALGFMDLVITIDTAVAHLAGALGLPVFLALPFASEWRWQWHREDSPWYPTLRIYRQRNPGDWASVVAGILADLTGCPQGAPETAAGHLQAALQAERSERLEVAEPEYRQAVDLDPGLAAAWAGLGGLLAATDRPPEAEEAYGRALQGEPGCAAALAGLAHLGLRKGRLAAAEAWARAAAQADPGGPGAELALAELAARRGSVSEARRRLEALRGRPLGTLLLRDCARILAVRLRDRASLRWAEEDHFQALPAEEAEFQRGFLHLLLGEFEPGWRAYENRFARPGRIHRGATLGGQPWRGEPFPGRTLLVHWEQGFGDTLMSLRFLPRVKARGGRVILVVQPELRALAGTCPGADEVYATTPGETLVPVHDLHVYLMSLPGIFGCDETTLPGDLPYLDTPPAPHRADLDRQLETAGSRLRIGLVWGANARNLRGANRSLPGAALAPLGALPEAAWFGLQLERADPPDLPGLVDLAPWLSTFEDTAWALKGLDLLITVDTAVAHLAGALGVPTFLLLSFLPDWRWMLDRPDSPWYPSLRLYRQPSPGDWDSVLRRIVDDLQAGR